MDEWSLMFQIEKGFNTDISLSGISYHIQTEDWGHKNPYLVSRIFRNGAVVKSIKTSYTDVLPQGIQSSRESVKWAMETQHHRILDLLAEGQML